MKRLLSILLTILMVMNIIPISIAATSSVEISPCALEQCHGETTMTSNYQGKITIYGNWTLHNNGNWQYREGIRTSGTSSKCTYTLEILDRYDSSFSFLLTERIDGATVDYNVYSGFVEMQCPGL